MVLFKPPGAATAAHQLYTMTVFSAAEAAGRPRYRANSSSNLFLGLAMIFNADGWGAALADTSSEQVCDGSACSSAGRAYLHDGCIISK